MKFNKAKLKQLIEYFNAKGLSKEHIAVKLNVSFSTLYKWINGSTVPGADTIYNIITIAKEHGAESIDFNSFFVKK